MESSAAMQRRKWVLACVSWMQHNCCEVTEAAGSQHCCTGSTAVPVSGCQGQSLSGAVRGCRECSTAVLIFVNGLYINGLYSQCVVPSSLHPLPSPPPPALLIFYRPVPSCTVSPCQSLVNCAKTPPSVKAELKKERDSHELPLLNSWGLTPTVEEGQS